MFIPDEFNNESRIARIKGIYIPCYLFNFDVVSYIGANAKKFSSAYNYIIKRMC